MKIELSAYEYTLCKLFSVESAKTQQDIEFGSSDTTPRSIREIGRDNMIGKMAEAAVSRMLRENYGLRVPVNYDIYPRGECDDCDIEINGWTVDIKATRSGKWLLLEQHKVDFRRDTDTLPDVVMFCRVPWDSAEDKPIGRQVDIVGCISSKKLLDPDSKEVLRLGAHEMIPGTSCRLQADNYAVKMEDLYNIEQAIRIMAIKKKGAAR